MAQCDSVVFKSLMVHSDAERCADCILAAVALADRVFFIYLACEIEAEFMLNFACLLGEPVFLHEGHHGAFHRGKSRREMKHHAAVAPFELLVFIAAAEHCQEHAVNTD